MTIKRLRREEISDDKWDACVRSAINGHVFALSWYLDIVCHSWEAIVIDDYKIVLALPVYRGNIFKRVYLPYWIPYLGFINQQALNKKKAWDTLQSITNGNIDMILNSYNKLPGLKAAKCTKKVYSVLDLFIPIERHEQHFNEEVKKAVEAYKNKQISVVRDLNGGEYIDFVRSVEYSPKDKLGQLLQIISFSLRYKSAGLYAAYDERNDLIAAAFFLKSNKSISLIHCAAVDGSLMGVKAIIYHLLKNNSGSNLTMEFPFFTEELGQYFTSDEHHCLEYKKGLPKWISLISS